MKIAAKKPKAGIKSVEQQAFDRAETPEAFFQRLDVYHDTRHRRDLRTDYTTAEIQGGVPSNSGLVPHIKLFECFLAACLADVFWVKGASESSRRKGDNACEIW